MPIPTTELTWTEDDIQAARRRGKKLALDHRDAGTRGTLDADAAWDLMAEEHMFADRPLHVRKTMAFEMADAYERFAKELREVAS